MAFNPFHKFRKHQKAVFAVLTILCMFTFVASAGFSSGGDFVSWMTQSFTGRSKYPTVAKLYGKNVDAKQISELEQQRLLAHEFLQRALGRVGDKISTEEHQQRLATFDKEPGHKGVDQNALQKKNPLTIEEFQQVYARYLRLFPYQGGTKSSLDFMIWQHQADRLGIYLTKDDTQKLLFRITNKRNSDGQPIPRLTAADANSILGEMSKTDKFFVSPDRSLPPKLITSDNLFKALGEEFRVQIAQMAFEGYQSLPMRSPLAMRELVEVPALPTPDQYWKYYREQCSTIDVALIPFKAENFLSEVKDKPSEDDLVKLYDKGKDREPDPLSQDPGFKRPRQVQVQWVSGKPDSPSYRETSARNAKLAEAVLMAGAGLNDLGAAATVFTDANVGELGLMSSYVRPSEASGWQIPFTTESDLMAQNLVWDYATRARFNEEVMKQPAQASDLVAQVLGAAGSGIPGQMAVASAPAAAFAGSKAKQTDLRLAAVLFGSGGANPALGTAAAVYYTGRQESYLPYKDARQFLVKQEADRQARTLFLDTVRQLQMAVEAKETPEGLAYLASLAPASPQRERATKIANAELVKQIAAIGLAADPLPGGLIGVPTALAPFAAAEKEKELDQLLIDLRTQAVAKFIKDHNLTTGTTTGLRDLKQNKIADDPGLKPLKDAYLKPPAEDSTGEKFGDIFFEKKVPFRQPEPTRPFAVEYWPADQFGMGKPTWRSADEPFIYWLTEDYPSLTMPLEPSLTRDPKATAAATVGGALSGPFGAVAPYRMGAEPVVRPQVEAAWKLLKARELAKKEAEKVIKEKIAKIAEAVNKSSATPEAKKADLLKKLKDLAAEYKATVIEVDPIAQQSYQPLPAEGEYRHMAPKIDKKKVPNLREYSPELFMQMPDLRDQYPYGVDFARELLKLRDKPKGDALVVPDLPQDTYYVAVIVNQSDPSLANFATVYRKPVGSMPPPAMMGMPQQPTPPFFAQFVAEMQLKYRSELMERLEKDAKLEILDKSKQNNPDEGE